MTIETKYDIGQAVWVIMNNKAQHLRIEKIEASIDKAMITEDGNFLISKYTFLYSVGYDNWYKENDIFPTKEELLKSL